MLEHTKVVGDRSVAKVLAALLDAGEWNVSIPWGDNTVYDLIIDKEGYLAKVQVKTGRLKKGAIKFPTQSKFTHKGIIYTKTYLQTDIDFFGVYCPETNLCYLVPLFSGEENKRAMSKNNQEKNIWWAKDFLLRPRSSMDRAMDF